MKKKAYREKIVVLEKGREKGLEGVTLPGEVLRKLELIPGAEVEVCVDESRRWIIIRALHGEDFLDHFRDSVDSMA